MREIKFRAWHSVDKVMVNFNPENLSESKTIYNYQAKALGLLILNKSPLLMQYTGLKDKNNIDLYENDIVIDEYKRIMQVVWCPDLELENENISRLHFARWEFKIIKNADGDYHDNFMFRTLNDWFYPENSVKIIGNTYENPELLRKL